MGARDTTTPSAAPATRRLTARQLTVWRSLVDTMEELSRRLTAQLQQVGLSSGDYLVMLTLSEAAEHHLRSSELADAIGWQRSRLSHHLGRMERRGLVHRTECRTDSRGAVVTITDEGLRSFHLASAPHLRAVKRHFADALTEQQFDDLESILHAVRTHLAGMEGGPGSPGETAGPGDALG